MSDYGYNDVAYSGTEAEIRLQRILEEREDIDIGMYIDGQKYKNYVDETLPGGKNYAEKVYEFGNTRDAIDNLSHFPDQEKQIAHKLGRDRLLEDGTVSVHADEIQSDLHKKGMKYGYNNPEQSLLDLSEYNRMSSKIKIEYEKLKDNILPIIEKALGGRDSVGSINAAEIAVKIFKADEMLGKLPYNEYLSLIHI